MGEWTSRLDLSNLTDVTDEALVAECLRLEAAPVGEYPSAKDDPRFPISREIGRRTPDRVSRMRFRALRDALAAQS